MELQVKIDYVKEIIFVLDKILTTLNSITSSKEMVNYYYLKNFILLFRKMLQ